MKQIHLLALVVLLLTFIPSVLAFPPPPTQACWVLGVINVGDNTSNLIIDAETDNMSLTQEVLSNHTYSFNALSGTNQSNITLTVCGFTQDNMTFPFEPFCATNNSAPWIERNINFARAVDGATGCTCSGVCAGGFCVNPTGLPGVCSSDPFFCDNDGICEAAYGENEITCPNDCALENNRDGFFLPAAGGAAQGEGSNLEVPAIQEVGASGDVDQPQGQTGEGADGAGDGNLLTGAAIGPGLLQSAAFWTVVVLVLAVLGGLYGYVQIKKN